MFSVRNPTLTVVSAAAVGAHNVVDGGRNIEEYWDKRNAFIKQQEFIFLGLLNLLIYI